MTHGKNTDLTAFVLGDNQTAIAKKNIGSPLVPSVSICSLGMGNLVLRTNSVINGRESLLALREAIDYALDDDSENCASTVHGDGEKPESGAPDRI